MSLATLASDTYSGVRMNITLTMDERNKDTGRSKNTHSDTRLIGGTLSVKSESVTQAGTVCSIFRTEQQ